MIISSELTGETYATVEECIKAEKEYKEKREELNKAYKEAIEACEKYFKLSGVDVKNFDIFNFII